MFRCIFGSRNDRILKSLKGQIAQINALEAEVEKKSKEEFQELTSSLRRRLANGDDLESLLVEAFAYTREAAKRTLGMRHFDVQLIGGIILHRGKIAEMATGEGKTLVATLPAYLNALCGSVHIVTVNDYLAKRDAEWMGSIYRYLGMKVGHIVTDNTHQERIEAYNCDVVYGTNSEFGFDYLRDNMIFSIDERVQKGGHVYGIIDEVDSILIDEARTPLIISGPSVECSDLYRIITPMIPRLRRGASKEDSGADYYSENKHKQSYLTDQGQIKLEEMLTEAKILETGDNLYDPKSIRIMHYVNACLRAYVNYVRDVDYIVKENQVLIIDEHTGRALPGRRWSDGLHQAVEAKEKVAIQEENQTLASITYQNYFRLYKKLAGMTGTADTEAYEFQQIYGLEVIVIPTNKKMIRINYPDRVFMTSEEKFDAILEEIKMVHERHQPILVGTSSIEISEHLANLLKKSGIKHTILNAKQHEREAEIIAEAGLPDSVTIATNMAGRGTDIILGGSLERELEKEIGKSKEEIKESWQKRHNYVISKGGLHIIGSERHESRRIDNQLRGRSGRQGDPGSARIYVSLEDRLMTNFIHPATRQKLQAVMRRLGVKRGEALENRLITKSIENSQRKVEAFNFESRKNLLEYDDVANEQRKIIYHNRKKVMEAKSLDKLVQDSYRDVVQILIRSHLINGTGEELASLAILMEGDFGIKNSFFRGLLEGDPSHEILIEAAENLILRELKRTYQEKKEQIGEENFVQIERSLYLQLLDEHFKRHLAAMDHLRQGIHLRGYAQKDPRHEYKRESFNYFVSMLNNIKYDFVQFLTNLKIQKTGEENGLESQTPPIEKEEVDHNHQQDPAKVDNNDQTASKKLDNNDQPASKSERFQQKKRSRTSSSKTGIKTKKGQECFCGSGKKFKNCHGRKGSDRN